MPKLHMNIDEFEKLFNEVKVKTKNFSTITSELFLGKPQYISIFRLILGYSLQQLGEILDKSYATISQYERGNIKNIPLNEADRYTTLFKKILPKKISFDIVRKNFESFRNLSTGGSLQAIKVAEKANFTSQEKQICDCLNNLGVIYKTHKTFETKVGLMNVDFWIPLKKLVIECSTSNEKLKIESLGFRIIKIKECINNCKGLVFLNKVTPGIKKKLIDYDYVINDLSSLKELIAK